jgi:hypothetical protein
MRHQIYATFTSANMVPLSIFNVTLTSGSLDAIGLAEDGATGAPIWLPPRFPPLPQSYVSFCGSQASLDPSGVGDTSRLPTAWFGLAPGTGSLVAIGPGLFGCLIAQVTREGSSACTHSATVAYKVAGTTVPLFGSGSFTVPAPGAMAMLLTGSIIGRRRRA